MGNSISGSSGGGGGNNNRPSENEYPYTVNVDALQDGHYVCFYSKLDASQVNNICESMSGVPNITDLTVIIAGVRSSRKTIDSKYSITSVELIPTEDSDKDKTDNDEDDDKSEDSNTDRKNKEADFGIVLDSQYYLVISSSLLETANNIEIIMKRSVSQNYDARIFIGSKYAKYESSYFDAYITNDFNEMLNSINPINMIRNMKIFMELPSIATIHFKIATLQSNYVASYSYIPVAKIIQLNESMSHITTVRNNANIMGIYYFDMKNKFIQSAMEQFVYNDSTIVTQYNKVFDVFSVGHVSPNATNKTVQFDDRRINLTPNTTSNSDFKLSMSTSDAFLIPNNISIGYQQGKRQFIGGMTDNVTQVFPPSQIIQLNREFQLYVGYIDPLTEIDIIGTLLNGINRPTNKFILYCSKDVVETYKLPDGLYKTSSNGITNINNLENGVNISTNFFLSMGVEKDASIEDYDIVNPHGKALAMQTLRNNNVTSKQAIFSSHTTDMLSNGGYVPDSELYLPASYLNDDKFVIVTAVDATPSGIWNMAKNLVHTYKRKNWVLYYSILNTYKMEQCNGYETFTNDNGMRTLYPNAISNNVIAKNSFSFEITIGQQKILLVSQQYIPSAERLTYISAFSVYPGKVPSTVANYQQFSYLPIKNQSIVDYNITDLQVSQKDIFIGGMNNTVTIYSSMTKFSNPTIDYERLLSDSVMFIDYFPTFENSAVLKSYLSTFETFMKQGSNQKTLKYMCLMRVRKEWIKNTPPNELYFEVIEGKNPDFVLIFMFGGSDTRYVFNSSTQTFTLKDHQSIVFDSDLSRQNSMKIGSTDIYIENPLEEIIKPSDEVYYINAPISTSFNILTKPITSYSQRGFLAFSIEKYNKNTSTLIMNGSVNQNDISFTRQTFLRSDWMRFIENFKTLNEKDAVSKTNCLMFFDIVTFRETNTIINSLGTSIQSIVDNTVGGPFENFRVITDTVNQIYILCNIQLIIAADSSFYTFNAGRMYIRSLSLPGTELIGEEDLLLDTINNKFMFNAQSDIYSEVSFSIRQSSEVLPTTYPQVDKSANVSSGITVQTDNLFWSSVRSFVYIEDIERFEVNNLLEMFRYLSINLDGFFIVTKVSYDITSPNSWMFGRCIVLRGNDRTAIQITYASNKRYYNIKLNDPVYTGSYMKFGLWDLKTTPTSADITDIDFLLNTFIGENYDGTMKVYTNERIGIQRDYMEFTFPESTLTSYPKFINFATRLNKYILFARPIKKDQFDNIKDMEVCTLTISLIDASRGWDFSEIINFVTQWQALTQNKLKSVIIHLKSTEVYLQQPAKEYTLKIDNLVYSTSNYTFTKKPEVILFPKVDFDAAMERYELVPSVYYTLKSGYESKSIIYYLSGSSLVRSIGLSSSYTGTTNSLTINHLNMQMLISSGIKLK